MSYPKANNSDKPIQAALPLFLPYAVSHGIPSHMPADSMPPYLSSVSTTSHIPPYIYMGKCTILGTIKMFNCMGYSLQYVGYNRNYC
ncbi:hypothetical protein EB796_014572 [Bugula neritina]|uniref:Uncharacterized protein n=1 Tax=Bugula neritina TaxID=10212 RepID=A0A7J7JNW4_BUGNE|nr:hypothetical protein EB796_014572 [Bugula neritina]